MGSKHFVFTTCYIIGINILNGIYWMNLYMYHFKCNVDLSIKNGTNGLFRELSNFFSNQYTRCVRKNERDWVCVCGERERERVWYGHSKVKRKICFTNPSEKDVFNLSKCSQDDLLGNWIALAYQSMFLLHFVVRGNSL